MSNITSAMSLAAGYTIVGAWDISTASYQDSFIVSSQDAAPKGISFKPDGTKMYMVGAAQDRVHEYNLSTAWDVTSASLLQNFSVSSQDSFPAGVFFKPDGTKMYICGRTNVRIFEYNLSTAWDVSTASYQVSFSLSSQDNNPEDVFFKPDGTKMYVAGNGNDRVYEYNLSTAWDITTSSFSQSLNVLDGVEGLFLRSDGFKMYLILSRTPDVAEEYDLSSAWDVSTASLLSTLSVNEDDSNPSAISFKENGAEMYILGATTTAVLTYKLGL